MARKIAKSSKNVPVRKTRGKKWVLALDPFSDFDLTPFLRFARQTAEPCGAELQAVYVLAPAGLNWTGEFSGPWMKKYMPIAQTRMDELLTGLDIPHKVLPCKESGQREAVKTLVQHAQKEKADCILISTHGRKGLERMALGSFAETLILSSKIPVMVTNPKRAVPQSVRRILVPTDLSKESEAYLEEIAQYARRLEAEVVLYYKQPDPLDPIIQQGVYSLGGGWVSVQNFIDEELARKSKRMEKMEKILRQHEVTVSHVLDSAPGDLVESIDRAARDTGADMVAVVTHASGWAATVLGSVARGLVRNASVPVLVQR